MFSGWIKPDVPGVGFGELYPHMINVKGRFLLLPFIAILQRQATTLLRATNIVNKLSVAK